MTDFCCKCGNEFESCNCSKFSSSIEEKLGWLKLENKLGDLAIKTLEQEIENLKYKNNYLTECALEEEKEYKEVLSKCSPYKFKLITGENKGIMDGYAVVICEFCGNEDREDHKENCRYLKLTK